MAAEPEVRRRFEEEARSAARLSHPNAVAVFDTGEDRGQPFIVMERLPGETLADRVRGGPADEAWLLGVGHDVLGALGAAHGAGLVHRDVKPGNILIGADGRAKVADFGIAKSVEALGAGHPDLTATNVLVGTPAYLAPERLDGAPASPHSFSNRKRWVRPDLSRELVQAVERAMARRPEDRFPTAKAMADALGPPPPAGTRWGPPGAEVGAEATLVKADRRDLLAGTGGAGPQEERGDTRVAPTDVVVGPGRGAGGRVARPPLRVMASALAGAVLLGAVLALVLSAGHRTAGTAHGSRPRLGVELRDAAARLRASGPAAGPQGPETARRLEEVAAATDAGGGAVEAQALVADVESWQSSRQLAAPAVGEAMRVLVQVPGVTLEPPAPPTTLSVQGGQRGEKGRRNNDNGNQGGGGD